MRLMRPMSNLNPSPHVQAGLTQALDQLARLGAPLLDLSVIGERAQAELALSTDSRLSGWNDMIERLPALMLPSQSPPLTREQLYSLELPHLKWGAGKDEREEAEVRAWLKELMPWRKGPMTLGPTHINTEWRSDWKWARVAPHLALQDKRVLDVGGGNGYYAWRMLEAGAEEVTVIDPTRQFFYQHLALTRALRACCKALSAPPPTHLPLTLEAFELSAPLFDVVLSMGVLYHRREPLEHLRALKAHLREGGQLVLETLVHAGEGLLEIKGRYANMRNMWALPSVALLTQWLAEAGMPDACCVDLTPTSTEEQRRTEWMTFYSLAEALNPQDPSRTIEGHPAPLRATLVWSAP
jgi:tRNA (mo5U34)-methyltransferase